MHQSPSTAHGFNHQSLFRQPVSNLRQMNEVVWNQNNNILQTQDILPQTITSMQSQQLQNGLINPTHHLYSSLKNPNSENNVVKNMSHLSRIDSPSNRYIQATGMINGTNQSQSLPRQSSAGAIIKPRNLPVPPSTVGLPNSHSVGALQDFIQKERKAHTMAPLTRIVGPSTNITANLFASTLAPSDAHNMKSLHMTQTMPQTNDNLYHPSEVEINDAASNIGVEEDDDDDDDAPIIVKVRYDPDAGGPPSEDVIRQAIDNKLKTQSGPRMPNDPIVLNFLKEPVQPHIPPIPFRPQQPIFNRPIAPLPPLINRSSIRPLIPLQQQHHQQQQQQQRSLPMLRQQQSLPQSQQQYQHQQLLQQQQQQSFQTLRQKQSLPLLQQQQQQQHQQQQQLLEQQQLQYQLKQQQLLLQEKQRQQQRLEQQRLEQQRLEQQRLEQQRLEQQRLEQQRLAQQRLEQQRFEQQRLEQERLEQQIFEHQRLEQQSLEYKRLEQQRIEQQRLGQQRLEQQILEEQRLEQQRLEKQRLEQQRLEQQRLEQQILEHQRLEQQSLEYKRLEQQRIEQQRQQQELLLQQQKQKQQLQQFLQQQQQRKQQQVQQQRYHQLLQQQHRQKQQDLLRRGQQIYQLQQQEKQQEIHERDQQIYEQHQQSYPPLPPMGPRSSRTVPTIRHAPLGQSPVLFLQNNDINSIQRPPLPPLPPLPPKNPQRIPIRHINTLMISTSVPPDYGVHDNYVPKPPTSTFIPISFDGLTDIHSPSKNNTSMSNNPQNYSQRPHTAPSSTEMFRPSSASDIPELSKENLNSMLQQIPDLSGRRFSIEYIEPKEPPSFPIPSPFDLENHKYPESVIVDQLPKDIIQHVRRSNNKELKVALGQDTVKKEKSKDIDIQVEAKTSKLKKSTTKVTNHKARPKQKVKEAQPKKSNSNHNDSRTLTR